MMTMSPLLQQFPATHRHPTRHGGDSSMADPADEAATSSLLTFVDMASSNIKLALDKPVRSKRKVNHRKYLQKQLKRCNGTTSGNAVGARRAVAGVREEGDVIEEETGSSGTQTPPSTPPLPVGVAARQTSVVVSHGQAAGGGAAAAAAACGKAGRKEQVQVGLQNKSLAALFDPRTLHERCCTDPQPRCASGAKVPLRQRNLPASFFTEPVAKLLNATPPPHDVATCGHSHSHPHPHPHPHPHSHPHPHPHPLPHTHQHPHLPSHSEIGYPVVQRLSMHHVLPVDDACVDMTYDDDGGAAYRERSSCLHTSHGVGGGVHTSHGVGGVSHDRDSPILDTVDQMLNGGEPQEDPTPSGRNLADLLAPTSGDHWPSSSMSAPPGSGDDCGGSRGSANTTPCSSASGGGSGTTLPPPPSPRPDLLEAALSAADVAHKVPLLSPVASPSPTSCSGGSVHGWSGYRRIGADTLPGGGSRGGQLEDVVMTGVGAVATNHRQGHGGSSRDSTPVPGPDSPPDLSTMEPEVTTMPGSGVYPCPPPVTSHHYSPTSLTSHYSTPLTGFVPPPPPHHPHSISPLQEFPYSRSPLPTPQHHPHLPYPHPPHPDDPRLYHPIHDDTHYHAASLPGTGTPPDFHTGYDPTGQSAHAHFLPGHHPHHLESQHHPGVVGIMGHEPYPPRDPNSFWQGTAVYGQLSSCYSYL